MFPIFLHYFHVIAKCDYELYKLLYNFPIYPNNKFENKMNEILRNRRENRIKISTKHTFIRTKNVVKRQ